MFVLGWFHRSMAGKTFPDGGECDASSWILAISLLSSFREYLLVVVAVVVVVAISYRCPGRTLTENCRESQNDRGISAFIAAICQLANSGFPIRPSSF
jgi:hypothetical protein